MAANIPARRPFPRWLDRTRSARRSVAIALFLMAALLVQPFGLGVHIGRADSQNAIQIENSQPGDPTWDDFASVASQDAISGYASPISVNHGQPVDFYVTTTAASFTMKIYRMGWYGGDGARLMTNLGTFTGVHQAIPTPDPVTGMVSCDGKWQKTTTLNIPSTWTTGSYLAKLTASNGNKSFIFFVVRNDGGTEALDFQTSVTTYQAYNAWGGISLYTNNTNGSVYPYAHATKVSFDRPFDPLDSNGAGHFLYAEYPFIRWAEKSGYDLTYTTDVDTDTNVNPLTNHRAYMSVGHDEYWTRAMRDNVQSAINSGVNAAFFGANDMYWQIRFEPNGSGVPNRVEVGYKDTATSSDPPGPDPLFGVNNPLVTTNWRDTPVNQPENAVEGVMYDGQVPNNNYAYVVQNSSNWVYAGTGFTDGTSVPGIVGYEYDKVWNNGLTPPGTTTLSNSPVCCSDTQWDTSKNTYSQATIYTAPSGALVFAAGTIDWGWGLDNYSANYANAGIQQMTANILNRFAAGSVTPPTATPITPTNTAVPPTNTPVPPTNTPVPPTNTAVPPTNTATPGSSTPTATTVVPTSTSTSTPVPPTATSTLTPAPTSTPGGSVIFSDGFESGSLPGAWTGTTVSSTNSLSLDSTLQHSGAASLLAVQTRKSAGKAYVTRTIAGQTSMNARGYYYLSNRANWGNVPILSLYSQYGFVGWVSYYADPSKPTLSVYNGANNTNYKCSKVPSLNAWHSIELQYTLSSSTSGSLSLWLDGTQVCSKTGIKTASQSGTTVNQVRTGVDGADNTVGLAVHVDDIVLANSYIGP